jgi:TRAP-type mannitol/chloroaromatic compound transport system substrate-binding protein
MQRRSFLKQAGGLGVAASGAAIAAPAFAADAPTLKWKLASAFTSKQDVLYGAADSFAKAVSEATDGRFDIRVSAASDDAPASGVLESVGKGGAEMGQAVSSSWYATNPALCFDAAVPFGLNARQMNAWMFEGDGGKLTRDLFKDQGIVNFPLGNMGARMGGWYRNEVKSIEGMKGLKLQASGFAAAVLERMGAAPSPLAGAEAAQALEKGELDAVAASNPHDDEKAGAPKAARFYYYPGWWEGGTQVSLYVNAKAWDGLPKNYRAIVDAASRAAHATVTARYDSLNAAALRRLVAGGALPRAFPRSVLDAAWASSAALYSELSAKDPKFKALYDSHMAMRDSLVPWFRMAEAAYDQYLGSTLVFRK